MSSEHAQTSAPLDRLVGRRLVWDATDDVVLDDSMIFGQGYDFFGLESLRREAIGPNGSYLMWPNIGKWSLYRDSDGAFAFERFASRDECEKAAERWCDDLIAVHCSPA